MVFMQEKYNKFYFTRKTKGIMVFGAYVVQCGSGINHNKVLTRLLYQANNSDEKIKCDCTSKIMIMSLEPRRSSNHQVNYLQLRNSQTF